ncbi:nucleoside ABC transporter membrane protein [Mycoplasmopsis mustelae]|uniref:Nucleoside ABC transporter membrane protein n=1 Tax=Mycoplasmopsis mustelae TaxID=171289 RepID=A0A4R7UCY0_9BACT|nr:ABC transporter permease [Mycoplasmopsis mustelae]TDV24322.1 nucleoside ABC transporter membrane protein [Mycoplasmopsis mustelae]
MEVILSHAVFFFCILLLGTISGIFSERAGIVNIAINGFMVFGAVIYGGYSTLFTEVFKWQSLWSNIPLMFLSSITTILFALLFGFAVIKLRADQTVVGFAINILAAGIAALMVLLISQKVFGGIYLSFRERQELALNTDDSKFGNIISLKVFVTVIIAFFSWFALRKTKWGLRFRAIGENPQAADVAGINVNKIKWEALVIVGIISGVAGSIFIQSNYLANFSLTKDVNGFGFIALSIMITSRWKVSLSILVSAFFSLLLSVSFYGTVSFGPSFEPYKNIFQALPYAVTLIVLILTSKNTQGPAAAGIPYDKSKR